MDLEQYPCFWAFPLQHFVNQDCSLLDDVGGGSLNYGINGHSFARFRDIFVTFGKFGDVAPASEVSFNVSVFPCIADCAVDKLLDFRVAREVVVDVFFRESNVHAGIDRKFVCLHSVDYSEVYRFCVAAHLLVNKLGDRAENSGCGACVNVFAVLESFDKFRLLAECRQNPELDLAVIQR